MKWPVGNENTKYNNPFTNWLANWLASSWQAVGNAYQLKYAHKHWAKRKLVIQLVNKKYDWDYQLVTHPHPLKGWGITKCPA